jgi:hypothetical protein
MKTKAFFLGTAVVLLAFSSCQKIKDSLTVKVPVEFNNDLQVKPKGPELKSGNFYEFKAEVTFNPSTDPTVIKYKEKIKSITASGISYTPTGLSQDIVITTANLSIFAIDTGTGTPIVISWVLSNVTLKNGNLVALGDPSSGSLDALSLLLDGTADIKVTWTGYQNVPVNEYTFTTTLKAEVLAYLLK